MRRVSAKAAETQARLRRVFSPTAPGFRRSVLSVATGAALAQVITAASSPVLTRLYTPRDFGLYGVYTAVLSVLVVVSALRFEFAIPLAPSAREAISTSMAGLLGGTALAAIVTIAVAVGGGPISRLLGSPSLAPYLWLLGPAVVIASLYQVLSFWVVRDRDFARLGRATAYQGAAGGLVPVCLSPLPAAVGLVVGATASRSAGTLLLLRATIRRHGGLLRDGPFGGVRAAAWRYRRFPLVSSWSAILNASALFAPVVILSASYSPPVVGGFVLAQRVIAIPLTIFGQSVAGVFQGETAAYVRDLRPGLYPLLARTSRILFAIAVLPAIAIAFSGAPLFALIFGRTWRQAGEFAELLTPMFLAQFVVSPTSQTLSTIERQHTQLLWDGFRFALVLASMAVPHSMHLSALWAVGTYSVTMTAAYAALLFLTRRHVLQRDARLAGGQVREEP